ncbi:hypothetical protein HID58_072947 [Brassica napus]|uniref:Uncharacterized protein n=1 Tax=Brassica napus TaxID=3708 RepID=A0ABQ7Z5U9_BRANA|nr:hypothetical protein HID58_072947 [Brassica napus]
MMMKEKDVAIKDTINTKQSVKLVIAYYNGDGGRRFNHLTSTPVEPRLAGVGPFNFRVLLSFFVSAQVQDLAFRSPLVKPVLGQRCLQFRVRSMRLHFLLTTFPWLENPLRHPPSIPLQVQLQASASYVCKSGVRGAPHLTRILDLEACRGFFDRRRTSPFGLEMDHFHFAVGLTSPTRLQGPHLNLAVSQPTLMWGGLVALINLLKISGGFIGVFTETELHIRFHVSCFKSSLSYHLPVGSPGPSLPSFASFIRSVLPPILWRCSFISIIVLLSCGAVCSGPEDAAGFVSMSFRGADWMLTSQFKMTISLLSDHVGKATLTHSSTVLNSLSSSSFEDLSFLSYATVVYVFNQRGWTIPSIICNQAS